MTELTLEMIDFLTSQQARPVLERLFDSDIKNQTILTILSDLRKQFTPAQASAVLDQARLRQKAVEKFPLAREMLFIDESLQQASSQAIAAYHGDILSSFTHIADLGSGIGGDALAIARKAASVWAVERNPLICRLLEHNLAVNGCAERVTVINADWTQLDMAGRDALFIDPARRKEGRRVFKLADMQPPIESILALHARQQNIAVKVAPGIAHEEIPAAAEVEFISEQATLKEALLKFGGLRTGYLRTATLLPGKQQMVHSGVEPQIPVSLPLSYIYEPDPAVIRASLVKKLADDIGASQLDSTIAYLTCDRLASTPFARAWQILQHGPFNLKTLNHWLREADAGEVIVKKRGSAIDPDAFRQKLKTAPKGQQITVFITRQNNKPWMLISIPVGPSAQNASGKPNEYELT